MGHVVVVGSVAVDEVVAVRGALRPGRHGDGERRGERLGGGAAGFAVPLARLGHRVSVFAALGQDAAGAWLISELEAAGVDLRAEAVVGPSTRSLVLVDEGGERTVVNLHRCPLQPPPDDLGGLAPDALYVRSRQPGLAPLLARQSQTALVVAHVPPCGALERPAHLLLGSQDDLPPEWRSDPWTAGRAVAGPPLRWVVITRGAAGATLVGPDGARNVPPHPAVAVDTTGAGDAFAAGLVHALLTGAPIDRAVELAAEWGSESTRWPASVLPAEAIALLARS